MFDLDSIRESHPALAREVEQLRQHIVREVRAGGIDLDLAAELLCLEPHVVRTLGGWPPHQATPKAPEAPAVAERPTRRRGRRPDPPGTPKAKPGSKYAKVRDAAISLAVDSDKCPPFEAIASRAGVSYQGARTMAYTLRKSGEWPFPMTKPWLAKAHALNGKAHK